MATGTQTEVVMPQMGVSVSEGTVTKWLKQVGETIALDEPLLEISTDKVDTEVPSPGEGVLAQILVEEGVTVEVGTVLAVIGAAGAEPVAPAAPAEPPAEPAAPSRCRAGAPSPWPPSRARASPPPPPTAARRRPRRGERATAAPSSHRSWRGSPPSTASIPAASREPAPAAA